MVMSKILPWTDQTQKGLFDMARLQVFIVHNGAGSQPTSNNAGSQPTSTAQVLNWPQTAQILNGPQTV